MTASSSIAVSSSRPVTPNEREHSESLHDPSRKSGPQGMAGSREGEEGISTDNRIGTHRIAEGVNEVAMEQMGVAVGGYDEKQHHS